MAVGALIDGRGMDEALDVAEGQLRDAARSAGTLEAVRGGRELGGNGPPSPEQLERLGGGWVGDEALAIALACVVSAETFQSGILAAVNHSGDSDSTGSIAGNLLGAAAGASDLPSEWLADLELHDVIEKLGRDAATELWGDPPTDEHGEPTTDWLTRYPGA